MAGISLSLRPGITGASINCVGMPAAVSSRIARKPGVGRAGAGLHRAGELGVERGDRDADADRAMGGKLLQDVDVAGDERVLGDDADGWRHSAATSRQRRVSWNSRSTG